MMTTLFIVRIVLIQTSWQLSKMHPQIVVCFSLTWTPVGQIRSQGSILTTLGTSDLSLRWLLAREPMIIVRVRVGLAADLSPSSCRKKTWGNNNVLVFVRCSGVISVFSRPGRLLADWPTRVLINMYNMRKTYAICKYKLWKLQRNNNIKWFMLQKNYNIIRRV